MLWKSITERRQRRTLRQMLTDPRAARGFRSVEQLEKAVAADRKTTERLLQSMGARKSIRPKSGHLLRTRPEAN